MSYTLEQRSALEKQWASQQAKETLPAEHYALWLAHRHVQRMMLGQVRNLIHYEVTKAAPKILGVYETRSVNANFVDGLSFSLVETKSGEQQQFGHAPELLKGSSVFVWATYFPDLQHTQLESGRFSTWFAIAVKFATRPENRQLGAQHLVDIQTFRRLHPNNTSI